MLTVFVWLGEVAKGVGKGVSDLGVRCLIEYVDPSIPLPPYWRAQGFPDQI